MKRKKMKRKKMKIKKMKSVPAKYKNISVTEAKANPEYWHVMENMFNEQAARISQRARRKLTGREFKGKYSETLNGPLTLQFIKEPTGKVYLKHARKIKADKYLELDFDEPEFLRNIYKALRLKAINVDQLAYAILLYDAREAFKEGDKYPNIKEYRFDDASGPYKPNKLSYATAEDMKKFNDRLLNIPETERSYFSITFPRKHEIEFLYCALTSGEDDKTEKYHVLPDFKLYIEKFIKKNTLNVSLKIKLIKAVEELFSEDKLIQLSASILLQDYLLKEMNENRQSEKTKEDGKFKGSLVLLIALLTPKEPQVNLYLTLSPDYNEKDPKSSLLCLNVPTVSAYKAFQHAIHGDEHAVDPYFSAGQFAPRLIRDLDENPGKYDLKQASRPIEIRHPDLISYAMPHTVKVHQFMNTWHDYAFHTSRCSAHKVKPLMRYLRLLLETAKGFDMSKGIYQLTDMDGNMGAFDRINNIHVSPFVLAQVLSKAIGGQFFTTGTMSDNKLLLVSDMIVNRKQWALFLDKDIKDFLELFYAFDNDKPFHDRFHSEFDEMEKVVNASKDNTKSKLFYVVAYRLKDVPDSLKLLQELDAKIGIDKIFHWDRNDGVVVNKEYFTVFDPKNALGFIPASKSLLNYFDWRLYSYLDKLNKAFESKNTLSHLSRESYEDQLMALFSNFDIHFRYQMDQLESFYKVALKHKMTDKLIQIRGNLEIDCLILIKESGQQFISTIIGLIDKYKLFKSSPSLTQFYAAVAKSIHWQNTFICELQLSKFKNLRSINIYESHEMYKTFINYFSSEEFINSIAFNNLDFMEKKLRLYFKIAAEFHKVRPKLVMQNNLSPEIMSAGSLPEAKPQNKPDFKSDNNSALSIYGQNTLFSKNGKLQNIAEAKVRNAENESNEPNYKSLFDRFSFI